MTSVLVIAVVDVKIYDGRLLCNEAFFSFLLSPCGELLCSGCFQCFLFILLLFALRVLLSLWNGVPVELHARFGENVRL